MFTIKNVFYICKIREEVVCKRPTADRDIRDRSREIEGSSLNYRSTWDLIAGESFSSRAIVTSGLNRIISSLEKSLDKEILD